MENFRNLKALELSLNRGFVVLHGENGAGKTNFLEGIYFGASLRRFPESELWQLLGEDGDFFRIRLGYAGSETNKLELVYEKAEAGFRSTLKFNEQKEARQKYTGRLPVVSFLPQDLNLLTRSPSGRRRYLDETLEAASAEYRLALSRYQRALRQRNELLAAQEIDNLEIWDQQLVDHGSEITAARAKFLEYLNEHLPAILHDLSPELNVRFAYLNSATADKQQFRAALQSLRKRELQTGATAMGPHRDDFEALVDNKRAAGYLSRGQMRAVTLALKILEKQYLAGALHKQPILLLDDVFSEFDSNHQQKLLEFLKTLPQVFFTTTHLEEIKDYLPNNAQIFQIQNSQIS